MSLAASLCPRGSDHDSLRSASRPSTIKVTKTKDNPLDWRRGTPLSAFSRGLEIGREGDDKDKVGGTFDLGATTAGSCGEIRLARGEKKSEDDWFGLLINDSTTLLDKRGIVVAAPLPFQAFSALR